MIDVNHLKEYIKEQKSRLEKLKKEQKKIEELECISYDLKADVYAYYKKEIDCCELNICGAEDKYYDMMNDAMDILAETGGNEND